MSIEKSDQKINKNEFHHSDSTRLSEVKPEKVKWLWPGRIASGKLTLIAGDPGLGKSLVSIDIAARISTGNPWPDTSENQIGDIVLISAEDDPADTIRPRFDAAGGNPKKVRILNNIILKEQDGEKRKRLFDLKYGIVALHELMLKTKPKIVIIDPVTAFLEGVDSHKNSDIRKALRPLSELANKHKTAILAVTHLNKGQDQPQYRVMGSLAFTAAARAVWIVAKDKNSPERRLILPIKNNLAPDTGGLAYRISTDLADNPVVCWEKDTVSVSVDDVLSQYEKRDRSKLEDAEEWLQLILNDGPMEVSKIKAKAKEDSVASWRTIETAKKSLDIDAYPDGSPRHGGKWMWKLKTAGPLYPEFAALNNH